MLKQLPHCWGLVNKKLKEVDYTMEIPEKVQNIIQRIEESEAKWKALYMAAWGYAEFYLKPAYKNTPIWEQKLSFQLPASRKGGYEFTPKELYEILTNKDDDFTLGHLQTLFTLFEELIKEACPYLCFKQKIDAADILQMEKFLKAKPPFDKDIQGNQRVGLILDDDIYDKLWLIKKTRNRFIHHSAKANNGWIKKYEKVTGKKISIKEGDKIRDAFKRGFPDELFVTIEDWHELIVELTHRIKEALKKQ